MALSETELKTKLVRQCRELGAYARRIEDKYGVGILDIIIAFPDCPVAFIEAKMTNNQTFHPTDRQWIEGDRIMKLGGQHAIALLIGFSRNGPIYFHEWAKKASITDCYQDDPYGEYGQALQRYMQKRKSFNAAADSARNSWG